MKKRWQKSAVLVLIILSMLGTALIGFGAEAETADEYVIYVSPEGDDSGDGSPDNMLKTPEGVQNFLRQSGVLGKKPIRVIFKDGNYYISKGLVFDEQDAGTKENPVVWQSETKGGAHFYGSTVLDGSKFTAVTDEDILARIPVEARGKVLQMDLNEQGITVEACPPYLWAGSKFTQPYTDLIVNGKEQMLARYPNGTNNYDKWEKVIDTFTTGSGKKGLEFGGTIKYSKPRLARWTTAKHAWIAGHTGYTYAIERVAVSSVDPEKGYIVCDESSVYAFRDASPRELQIFNLIEELDCATEWYIDWDTNILYYLPPNEIDDNTVLELITLNDDMLTFRQGIDLYMTIKDFELSKTRKRLAVLSGNNVTLDGCTLTYSKGATAVYLSGDNVQVKNNVIAFHDGNAVRIYGGGTMIKKTTRTHSKVENNYMYEVGRHNVTGGHAMSQEGACVDIMHNTAHYVEHGTYSAGWEARDTKLMYNEFYNFGRNLSDVGAYYMRYSGSALGNEVAYNYFYDYGPVNKNLGSAIQGIYYDDGYSHGNAHHNTMINGSGYGVQLGGGKSNKIESNIMVNMGNGPIVSDARGETWANGAGMGNKTIPETQSQLKYTPWFGRVYPHLNHAGEAAGWHAPYGNVIRNNISDKEFNFNARVAELGKIDGNVVVSDHSHFVDPENYDFRIKDDSIFASKIPELTESNFDLSTVGCSLDVTENIDTSFRLLYPAQGGTFNSATALFVWEKAATADSYRITVATDAEMKNIICDEVVPYNSTSVEGLEEGKTYWWKVDAVNSSFKRKNTWGTEPQSFVNTINYIENISDILYKVNENARQLTIYDLSNFGEAEIEGVKKTNDAAMLVYNEAVKSGTISKAKFDETINMLADALTKFERSEVLNYTKLDSKYFASGDEWHTNGITATPNSEGISFERIDPNAGSNITLKEMPAQNDIIRFRAKINYLSDSANGSWASFDLRRKDTAKAGWQDEGIMFIVKRQLLELQIYPGGIIHTIENKWTKDGQWNEYAIGVVTKEDGARIVVAIDGEVVFDIRHTGPQLKEPGYLASYVSAVKLSYAESQTGDIVINSGASDYYAGGTAYSESGTWTDSETKGVNNSLIKVASASSASATWTVDKVSGSKKVYFRRVAMSDGDTTAKVTIYSDYNPNQEGEEVTKEITVDLSSGESEWIELDDALFQNGKVQITLQGSGSGNVYANAIRIEDK